MPDLLDPNPFANPILAEKGNHTAREIYVDVGFSLDRWEHCDTDFAVLYSALIGAGDSNYALMQAFGMIFGPKTKKDMMWAANDAAFHARQSDDEETSWQRAAFKKEVRKLLNLYMDAASRRNEIAHAMVMGQPTYKVVEKVAVPLPTVWFLVPPLFATKKNEPHMGGPKYRYSTKELSHFTKCFEELSTRASRVTQAIRAFHASLREKL